MKKLALGALFVGLLAACGGSSNPNHTIVVVDSSGDSGPMTCSPLTQAGCQANEKCTWIIDATMPMYVGHIGCVPDGTAALGAACQFGAAGATGYDNCAKGNVCSAFGATGVQGVCKQICDNQGGQPMCDSTHVCVQYARLFSTGATSPAAAGICDLACDPLADNDFDGSGSGQGKTGTTCGSDKQIGCYGYPSGGTPPATGWSCTGDINTDIGSDGTYTDKNLRHRALCDSSTGCAETDGTIYTNSCNQGYLPLFNEKTGVTTTICQALCKPIDCYDGSGGHCGNGSSNGIYINQHGATPHRCVAANDGFALGVNANATPHETCTYMWYAEIDGSNNWLPSPTSNTVGFCMDWSQYKYDANGDGTPETTVPDCDTLQLDGSDPNQFYAVSLACVSTTTGGIGSAQGKLHMSQGPKFDPPRFLYHRVMGAN